MMRMRKLLYYSLQVDQTVREVLANLQITVYSAHYFESWTLDESSHLVTHVDFLSTFRLVRLPCTAFFYYGKRGIDPHALVGKIYKNYYFLADCSA